MALSASSNPSCRVKGSGSGIREASPKSLKISLKRSAWGVLSVRNHTLYPFSL